VKGENGKTATGALATKVKRTSSGFSPLTFDQKTHVHQILGDTREQLMALRKESEPRVGEIRRQADERLQKIL